VTVGLRGNGHGDAGGELDPRRRLGGERHDDVGVVLGLLGHQPVVAQLLDQTGIIADARDVERRLGGAQAGIDLAEGEKGFELHACPLWASGREGH
jgi:hypothetical protein